MKLIWHGLAALALGMTPVAASAHITLDKAQTAVGASYKATFRVPHGCDGAATTKITVTLPEGFIAAKPMPKPGWQLKITKGAYEKTYAFYHGEKLSKGATEVAWSGGTLPDDEYDEFVVAGFVAGELAPDHRLYFPVTQDCEKGSAKWAEIPAEGQSPHALKFPAPGVMLVVKQSSGHMHMAAAAFKVGALVIEAPWSRATPGGAKTAGGYLKVTNTGSTPDRLLRGTFAVAGKGEVHEMSVQDGVMKMRELGDGLEIKPGQSVELKPGGFHMMFMDLKEPLKAGQTIKGTLVFEKAGSVDVEYAVRPMGATSGGMGGMEHKH
jgi:uncharacterized protein YcnI/copper(I)-binding protein